MTAKTKVLDGVVYEVHELKLRDVVDLLGAEGVNFSLELFKRAVRVNGVVLGAAAEELPLRHYTALLKLVNSENTTPDETEGNA